MEPQSAEFTMEIGSLGIQEVSVQSLEFGYEDTFRRILYFRPIGTAERRSFAGGTVSKNRRVGVEA